jgi:2-polyprenyl-6-methoxyphenol hydroxylase-like FAD-dependent oxidoreductase
LLVADINAAQQTTGTLAMAGRLDLHRALREPLPDEVVHLGMPVERLEQDDAEVWAVSGGQRVTSADVAVVADGIGSGLRRLLFPGHPGLRQTGRLDLRGMLAVPDGLALDGLLASNLIDRRTGSGFGLYPVGDDRLYWYTDSVLHGEPPTPEQARRDVLALTADLHPAVPALIEATSPADIFVDAIACLAAPLPAFNVGRIALMGDAAHAMPPDLGQGASQAFEDAAELVRVGPHRPEGRCRPVSRLRRPAPSARQQAAASSTAGISDDFAHRYRRLAARCPVARHPESARGQAGRQSLPTRQVTAARVMTKVIVGAKSPR